MRGGHSGGNAQSDFVGANLGADDDVGGANLRGEVDELGPEVVGGLGFLGGGGAGERGGAFGRQEVRETPEVSAGGPGAEVGADDEGEVAGVDCRGGGGFDEEVEVERDGGIFGARGPGLEAGEAFVVEVDDGLVVVQRGGCELEERLRALLGAGGIWPYVHVTVRRRRTDAQLGIEELEEGDLAIVSVAGDEGLAVSGQGGEAVRAEREAKEKLGGAGGFRGDGVGQTAVDRHRHIDLDGCLLRAVGGRSGGSEQGGECGGTGCGIHQVPGGCRIRKVSRRAKVSAASGMRERRSCR